MITYTYSTHPNIDSGHEKKKENKNSISTFPLLSDVISLNEVV